MLSLRSIAIGLSLSIHGSIALAMLDHRASEPIAAFDAGTGNDSIFVEQGIAIEGLAKLGDAIQTIEATDITPVAVEPPPPPTEVKELDELNDVITSDASTVEDNIVKAEEPQETTPPKPEVDETQEQPQQVAMVSEQSSGEARLGSAETTARTEYLGRLRDVLERAKINPRSRKAGTVWVRFKVGPAGELLEREITTSSGSKILDEAAVAALDRAAPFPPMPRTVANEPMVVSVPFKFITR